MLVEAPRSERPSRVYRDALELTAACTNAVTSTRTFAPTVFGTATAAACGPKSPPVVVHAVDVRRMFHVACSCTNDVVTGKTPTCRVVSVPAVLIVRVITADWIFVPAGIVFCVSNLSSARRR